MIGVDPADIPYTETRNYVNNVMNTYKWLLRLQRLKNIVNPGKTGIASVPDPARDGNISK